MATAASITEAGGNIESVCVALANQKQVLLARNLLGAAFPFECDNCGHKPTPQQVVAHRGDCEKCGDTVVTYTVDAAELICRMMPLELIPDATP